MIILDTNVVSEPMRPQADATVQAWLDEQVAESLFLTATSFSELLLGLEILPDGRRKERFQLALTRLLIRLFGPRLLPFDIEAAKVYAPLMAHARGKGHTISVADGQIAAIAASHGFIVATRDTEPFLAVGVPVINPWKGSETINN